MAKKREGKPNNATQHSNRHFDPLDAHSQPFEPFQLDAAICYRAMRWFSVDWGPSAPTLAHVWTD